ncbi:MULTISPECIES: hypothetical protein [unclassified Paenarthrobacter]|uniref:hypothetical protein n=1 Tax=unclassified Paenarthrobacter TaxID=2634190 RepID=UPI001F22303F|nr:hypothetical protein [Paenarthrobacter sp. AR 02]MCF3140693.1 hypothetical protein [Paenarthrobacter sp. AR 02]
MTYRDTEREAIVDGLMLDAELADAPDVRQALLSLGSFANVPAPAPGTELAAMLAGPHDELSKRRWRHKHRTAVVSVAVVAAMGLGVSGVAAASSGFTRSPSFDGLLGNFAPRWSASTPVLPAPDAPKISTEPAPAVDPAALPPATPAPSIPVPAPAEPAAPSTPAQDAANAPAPAPGPEGQPPHVPGADEAKSGFAKGQQEKPAPGSPGQDQLQRPAAPKPDMSKAEADKPGKQTPGKPGNKGQALPSYPRQWSGEQVNEITDKLKQWKKHGGSWTR